MYECSSSTYVPSAASPHRGDCLGTRHAIQHGAAAAGQLPGSLASHPFQNVSYHAPRDSWSTCAHVWQQIAPMITHSIALTRSPGSCTGASSTWLRTSLGCSSGNAAAYSHIQHAPSNNCKPQTLPRPMMAIHRSAWLRSRLRHWHVQLPVQLTLLQEMLGTRDLIANYQGKLLSCRQQGTNGTQGRAECSSGSHRPQSTLMARCLAILQAISIPLALWNHIPRTTLALLAGQTDSTVTPGLHAAAVLS